MTATTQALLVETPAVEVASRSRTPRTRRRTKPRGSVISTVLIWLCVAYFVLPLLWLVFASTKTNSDLFSTFGFWFGPDFALWDNVVAVFNYRDGLFIRWMMNSLLYSVVSGVGSAFLSTAAGYAFAKYRFPADKLMFAIAIGGIMIPATALALPQYLLFGLYGMTNSPLAVILPALAMPIGVFIMRVYSADAIPDSLIEAARMDGAGELRIFFQIALRLLVPGFITVLLFSLVFSWNNYLLPLIMIRNEELFPVVVGLAQLNATSQQGSGAEVVFSTVITGSMVSVIPLVIAFAFLQRYWQNGLTAGSVKM
jgi:multiple sugar transport system permease protein